MRKVLAAGVAVVALSGCTTSQFHHGKSQVEQKSKVLAASEAVKVGRFDHAETMLADYVFRDKEGHLKLKYIGLSGESKKVAVDTIAALLWETGRDATLTAFADDYLPRYERKVTHCRLAERQANYPVAYRCWNDLGHVDRADRVVRTEAAIRILRN